MVLGRYRSASSTITAGFLVVAGKLTGSLPDEVLDEVLDEVFKTHLCAVVFFSFFGVEIEGDPDDTVAFFCSW